MNLPDDIHILTKSQINEMAECVKTDGLWGSLRNEGSISIRKQK